MKIFDVVNEQDQVTGSATAQECHSNPKLIHRVVHFTLVDGIKEKILISQRALDVKFDSGKWCFMGEHLLRGDDYPTAVFRV
jgi:isopentenyldiphosphate isomerase